MNYFKLFAIPELTWVDKDSLQKAYVSLQKQSHPDYHMQSMPSDLAGVQELSSAINSGYSLLKKVDGPLRHWLELRGQLNENDKYALTPEFLMEMMELNEMADEDPEAFAKKKRSLLENLEVERENLKQITISDPSNESLIADWKDYYYRKKYFERLRSV